MATQFWVFAEASSHCPAISGHIFNNIVIIRITSPNVCDQQPYHSAIPQYVKQCPTANYSMFQSISTTSLCPQGTHLGRAESSGCCCSNNKLWTYLSDPFLNCSLVLQVRHKWCRSNQRHNAIYFPPILTAHIPELHHRRAVRLGGSLLAGQ